MAHVNDVPGDIVECGVGRGATLLFWSLLSCHDVRDRRIWAFDSFGGFPEPSAEDESPRNTQRGDWAVTTLEGAYETLLASGLSAEWVRSHVLVIKGFFNESLSKYDGDGIALLYIDADLYRSYQDVLGELYQKVVPNGVVAFDEYLGTWEHYHFPGAKQAIDEFVGEHRLKLHRDPIFGKYYFVKQP